VSDALDALIQALRVLPGVGQKSAQRMAYHLLQHQPQGATHLAHALTQAVTQIGRCRLCQTFSELDLCAICSDTARHTGQLCVVETPADLAAFERMGSYGGLYHVLMGRISPLDGVGPRDIGLDALLTRMRQHDPSPVQELILATNFTAQGETTAHILQEVTRSLGIKVTRLARGVPLGSELEYVDLGTIAHAFIDRR
jgi:recombination protein RecR